MTQKLGFREDYDRFYQLFVKDVRDGKLGRYTLDRVGKLMAAIKEIKNELANISG